MERFLLLWMITVIGGITLLLCLLIWGAFEAPENGPGGRPELGLTEGPTDDLYGLVCIWALLVMVLHGAISYAVYRTLRGEEAGFGDCLVKGMYRLGTFFLTGFLLMYGLSLYYGLVAVFVFLGSLIGNAAAVIVRVAGYSFGVVLALKVCLAIPVCMIEKAGPIQSLKRSFQLSRGNLGRMFLVVVAFGMISMVNFFFLRTVSMGLLTGAVGGAKALGFIVSSAVLCASFIPPMVSLPIMYCQLRGIKENHSVVDEADVFI